MKLKLTQRVLLVLLCCAIASAAAAAAVSWTLQMSGTIISPHSNELIVTDATTTNEVHSIDWGEMEVGHTYTRYVYVRNTGDTSLTLHLVLSSNSLIDGGYGQISWDKEGYVLGSGDSVQVEIEWSIFATGPTGGAVPLGSVGPIEIYIQGSNT